MVLASDGSVRPETVLAERSTGVEDWDLATNGEDYLLTYGCDYACRTSDPRSGVFRRRMWSVEVDGVTHQSREATRAPITDTIPAIERYRTRAAAAAAQGRWIVLREEGDGAIWLDGTRLFQDATHPKIAVSGGRGLAIALRGSESVARTIYFGDGVLEVPPPIPDSADESSRHWGCSVANIPARASFEAVAMLAAVLISVVRKRRVPSGQDCRGRRSEERKRRRRFAAS